MLKNSFFSLIFKVIGAGLQFVVAILISRLFSASILGLFSIALSFNLFWATFSKLGFDLTLLKTLSPYQLDLSIFKNKFFLKHYIWGIITGTAIGFFIFFSSFTIANILFQQQDLSVFIKILSLTLPFIVIFHINVELIRSQQKIKLYSFLQSVLQPLTLIFFITYLLFNNQLILESLLIVVFSSYCLSSLISLIIFVLILNKQKTNLDYKTFDKSKQKVILQSLPFLLITLISFLMGSIDSFLLTRYSEAKYVGYYSACQKYTMLISFILVAFNSYLGPQISFLYQKNQKTQLSKIIQKSTLIMTFLSLPLIILYLTFPQFFLSFFGYDFKEASIAFQILTIAQFINVFFGPVGLFLMMTRHNKVLLYLIFLSFIVLLVSGIVLIPKFNLEGAALAQVISSFVLYFGSYLSVLKLEKFSTITLRFKTVLNS
jgi:O-antigen/teichoic acid export membrane protein